MTTPKTAQALSESQVTAVLAAFDAWWPPRNTDVSEFRNLIAALGEDPTTAQDERAIIDAELERLYREMGSVITGLDRKREPTNDETQARGRLNDWSKRLWGLRSKVAAIATPVAVTAQDERAAAVAALDALTGCRGGLHYSELGLWVVKHASVIRAALASPADALSQEEGEWRSEQQRPESAS